MLTPSDVCEVKRCKRDSTIIYSASKSGRQRGVCSKHWNMHCQHLINLKSKQTYKKSK